MMMITAADIERFSSQRPCASAAQLLGVDIHRIVDKLLHCIPMQVSPQAVDHMKVSSKTQGVMSLPHSTPVHAPLDLLPKHVHVTTPAVSLCLEALCRPQETS